MAYPPLEKYDISSPYGMRGGVLHRGVDIPTPMNTPLPSPIDGTIAFEGRIPAAAPGYPDEIICIIQGSGQFVVMGHLSRTVVDIGQKVKAGDLVAYSGNTGYSTGPHLHIELAKGTKSPSKGILAYSSIDITPLLRSYGEGGSMTEKEHRRRWAESIVNMVLDVIEGDPHYKNNKPKAWQGHVNRLINASRIHEERYFLRDILRYNRWVKDPKPETKEVIKEVPVTVEVPVEVIKEVPVEVIKEVRTPAQDLSAVEHLRLALRKFIGLEVS